MEKIHKKVKRLVKHHPEGIPLSELGVLYHQRYKCDLTVEELGFPSTAEFIASMQNHLLVHNGTVFHKKHSPLRQDADSDKERISQEVVDLVSNHPDGIPLTKLSMFYNKTYKQNLAVSRLGFSSAAALVASLTTDLLVENNRVFHKVHRDTSLSSQPSAPLTKAPPPLLSSTGISFGVSNQDEMSLEELLEKVTEVIRVYPAAATSLTQLQNGYFLLFGKILPLKRYMSLYDSQTSKQQALPVQAPVNTKLEGSVAVPVTTESRASVSSQNALLANEASGAVLSPVGAVQPAASTPPLPTVPSSLEDFPPLSTRPSGPEKKSKEKQEGGGPVFREAYHAQLREVHKANVRAEEALEQEADGAEECTSRRRRKVANPDDVNSLAEDAIRSIAADGELVTYEKVVSKVCTLMQVSSLHAVRIEPRWQLPALKDLQRTIKEINLFIQSVEMASSMCTLYELGHAIAGLKNKKRFEELHLGPLCKFPLVHRLFKIDSNTKDDDIHQIETVDILRSLRNFRRKHSKAKIDLAEFMKYLADQYNCESPYELGIRIQSVGLPISTLSKAYSCERGCMDKAREVIQKEIEEEVQSKLWKIKRNLLDPAQGMPLHSPAGSLELRKKYASLTAAEAVMEVFTNSVGIFSEKMTKRVQDFLMHVSADRLARTLFQLAICGGSLVVPHDLAPKDKGRHHAADRKSSEEAVEAPPTEAAVRQYFQECVSAIVGTVSLASLCRLEQKVTEHFRFRDFRQLHLGSFLEFLVKNTQFLQEAVGGTLTVGSQDVRTCVFRPSQQDVYEFIKQCGEGDPSQLPLVEAALRSQYGLQDCRELGYGPLHTLAHFARRQRELCGGGGAGTVRYECPLLPRNPGDGLPDSAGLLGEVGREQAMASLLSTPLLQELSEWSQWPLVFQPSHGALKDFIEKYCNNTDLLALEVSPGVLLRITTVTSDKHFCEAAQALDPTGTAGHLVSIVVAHGMANTPTALLANHMEGALATAVAQDDLTLGEDDCTFSIVAKFLLDCITLMPTRICRELLQQVFLEPLSKVLGQAKSKSILLEAARGETRYLSKLHQMGILLGLTEWVKDFHKQMVLPSPELCSHPAKSQEADSVSDRSPALSLVDSEDLLEESVLTGAPSPSCSQQDITDDGTNDNGSGGEDDDEDLFELASEASRSRGEDEEDEEEEASDTQPEEAVPASESLSQHRAIIQDIRKSEFGIGVELNEEGQKLMRKQQQRLGRSLERLSAELYSRDTHFVLELIQNADDNSYPPGATEQPSLAFVVQRDCIAVLNNECGFEERHVRAICDVGRSTKGKHTCGYIGQKGIGFKSVFKVTDCPEIHSNGFHILFDKTSDPMGYILPHWVEEERAVHSVAKEIGEKSWTTQIFLPLRSECYQTKNLFHDVHPSLLLFLHRLRSISIYSEAERRLVSMTRRDLSHDMLEVKHTDGVERWLVVKKVLHPKKIKEGVASTELALAFQLADSSAGEARTRPAMQPVFAFLPLRSFGFRFIVQGDFDIPSSREDVDRDSPWNQYLRSEIPQLFLQAMDVFSKHPEFHGLQGLCHFLQFIPQPSEVLDFFSPVANQIIQLLKGRPCLPARENTEGCVEFKLPSQVAMCQDPLIQDVIGEAELGKHLSLSYLHPALHSALLSPLLSALGVQRLRAGEVTSVVAAVARGLAQHGQLRSDAGLKKLAKLLACNFRALDSEYGEVDSLLQSLRSVPMIPLADGRVVAVGVEGVFFPLSDGKRTHTAAGVGALYADLSVVEPRLLACLDELGNSQVRELLRRLQVHELEPEQVLQQHIYPTLKSSAWKAKTTDITVSYLVFIKQHGQVHDYLPLRTDIPVLTNKGFLCPSQTGVHFSKEYGNMDLPAELPGVDWVLLDTSYLQAEQDVDGWRELFSQLGVRDLLIFRKERHTLSAAELASSPWAAEAKLWPKAADGTYVLEDQWCEEFRCLATAENLSAQDKLRQRQALLNLLERHWDTGERYSQYLRAQVQDGQGRPRDCGSSFYHQLTQLAWVPAQRTTRQGEGAIDYLRPSAVYLFSDDVYRLLGSQVHYINLAPSDFSRAAGMRQSVGVEEMVGYLKRWCTREPDGPGQDEQEEFTTNVGHIHAVYCYLQAECSSTQLRELFHHFPAVFIEYERTDDWCSGRFYHLKDVCWSDPTGMFVRYKDLIRRPESSVQEPKVLAPFYSSLQNMKDLFRSLSVEPSPSMKQYVDLLEAVSESAALPTGEVLQDVSVIFARLADKCKYQKHVEQDQDVELNPHYCKSLKEMVTGKKVFPSKTLGWVTLARKPMVADSPNLEKIFKSHSEVCLLNLPPAQKKDVSRLKQSGPKGKLNVSEERMTFSEQDRELFLDICGVKRFSHCVTTEAQTESYRPCPAMQALVRDLIPYLQRFMYHHEDLRELYRDVKDAGIAQEIRALTFGQVGKLYIYYCLEQPDEKPIVESDDIICLLKDRKDLYIQKDHLLPKLDICRELVKLFTAEKSFVKELEHFLEGLVTCIHEKAALKRFLDRKDVPELPEDEEKWEVPAPVEVKLEVAVPSAVYTATAVSALDSERKSAEDEDKLQCWPPRASLSSAGGGGTGWGSQAVEAVMKMWPPPAPLAPPAQRREGGANRSSSSVGGQEQPGERHLHGDPGQPHAQGPQPSGTLHPAGPAQLQPSSRADALAGQGVSAHPEPPAVSSTTAATAGDPHSSQPSQQVKKALQPIEAVASQFQGGSAHRAAVLLGSAAWSKPAATEAVLEDLVLDCGLPQCPPLPEDYDDTAAIGVWGEQLVYSFLGRWREMGGGPRDITWYNQDGESGQPCDFKLTFADDNGATQDVFVEVKTTMKQERHYVRLSANELDFALKEKSRYHVYRVYGAGDAQSVRLCRIRNLAQHLHSKTLELFLFV